MMKPIASLVSAMNSTKLIAMSIAAGLCVTVSAQQEAPTVADRPNISFTPGKPEMFKNGWVDLDKDGIKSPFEDPARPVEERVQDLLKRMDLSEKIGQCHQFPLGKFPPEILLKWIVENKVGSALGINGSGPEMRNQLQQAAVEHTRLGIPLVFGYDTIHGLRTIFPIPLAQSCSWDPALLEKTSHIAARESKALGIDWTFAPMVDIARDPRWGRIAEGNGEDPYLGGLLTAGAVKGFQGDSAAKSDRIASCLKHYVGYGAAEGGRDYNTTEIGIPTLRNIYLPPFKAGVDAGAHSIMSAFNCLNGIPASGNQFTLDQVLRKEWKFDGMVVSDYDSVLELIRHGFASDESQAAELGMNAGVDLEMASQTYLKTMEKLIAEGRVSMATLDEAVRRILRFKIRCGLFERPYADKVESPLLREDAIAIAREAAAASAVLLKNKNDLLPLKPGLKIALIGPYADNTDLNGCWRGIGNEKDVVTFAKGISDAFGKENVVVVRGCGNDPKDTSTDGIAAALQATKQADVVILALGEPASLSGEAHGREWLNLPGPQNQLVEQITAAGKPVVTLLACGRPLAIPELYEKSDALLIAWHGGVQAGNGIADLLSGKKEPTGRLTATWPYSLGQVPIHYNHQMTSRGTFADSWSSNYCDGPRTPLFPFGAGIGYTTFAVEPVKLDRQSAGIDDTVTASVQVRNTGNKRGSTIVQCYIRDHAAIGGVRPIRELRGYERVTLSPGESKTLAFELNRKSLGYWLPNGQWGLEPGKFSVWVGLDCTISNQADFELQSK